MTVALVTARLLTCCSLYLRVSEIPKTLVQTQNLFVTFRPILVLIVFSGTTYNQGRRKNVYKRPLSLRRSISSNETAIAQVWHYLHFG